MQIKDLPASSVLNADDVLAKDTNGVTTQKITAEDLAAGVKSVGKLAGANDIAIIINGNKTTHTGGAAQGDFVIVRNSTINGITEGLYTAAQAIPANTAIDSTYLTAVDGGGLNAVSDHIENIKLKKKTVQINNVSFSNGAVNISSHKPSGMNNFLFATLAKVGTVSNIQENIGIYSDGSYAVSSGTGSASYLLINYWYLDE